MKLVLNLLFSLFAACAFAGEGHSHDDGHDHEKPSGRDHMATLGEIRLLHAWASETEDSDVLVYVEIENNSGRSVTLIGAQADFAARTELVGFQSQGGTSGYTRLPKLPISAGAKMILEPKGVALRMVEVDRHLHEGDDFEFTLVFEQGEVAMTGQVEAENAAQHSHAGHNH